MLQHYGCGPVGLAKRIIINGEILTFIFLKIAFDTEVEVSKKKYIEHLIDSFIVKSALWCINEQIADLTNDELLIMANKYLSENHWILFR